MRETAHKLREIIDPGTVVISVSKGIEKDSSLRLSQVIEDGTGRQVARWWSCPALPC